MSRLSLWVASSGGEPARLRIQEVGIRGSEIPGAVRVSEAGVESASGNETDWDAVLVLPLEATQGPVAAALVPEALDGIATRHGLPLEAGLHLLRHADRIDLAGWTVWIAGDGPPVEEPYDEAVHGAGQHCGRTRARLNPGELVVRCPGTATAQCGMLYRADAWRLHLPCHSCRHDPKRPAWRPPAPQPRSRIHELVRLLVGARS